MQPGKPLIVCRISPVDGKRHGVEYGRHMPRFGVYLALDGNRGLQRPPVLIDQAAAFAAPEDAPATVLSVRVDVAIAVTSARPSNAVAYQRHRLTTKTALAADSFFVHHFLAPLRVAA
jgi:hypothetical protein